MRSMLLLLTFLSTLISVHATAQTNRLISSSPVNGSAGVPAGVPVEISFTIETAIPEVVVASDFLAAAGDLQSAPQPPGMHSASLSEDGKTITYTYVHKADTDYIWIVGGYYFANGVRYFFEPSIVQYSTREEMGSFSVSGQTSISWETSPGASAAPFRPIGLKAFHRAGDVGASTDLERSRLSPAQTSGGAPFSGVSMLAGEANPMLNAATETGYPDLVLLVNSSDPNPYFRFGNVVSAALTESDGSYVLPYVRPGTYYVIAFRDWNHIYGLRYSDAVGLYSSVIHSGAYDVDGDRNADETNVSSSGIAGVDIALFPSTYFGRGSAESLVVATDFIASQTGRNDLRLAGISARNTDENGLSADWEFSFYAPATASTAEGFYDVHQTAFLLFSEGELQSLSQTPRPLPSGMTPPTMAVTTVLQDPRSAEFLAPAASWTKFIRVYAGDAVLTHDNVHKIYFDNQLIKVHVFAYAPDFESHRYVTAYLDAATGEIIDLRRHPGDATEYIDLVRAAVELEVGPETEVDLYGIYPSWTATSWSGKAIEWSFSYFTPDRQIFVNTYPGELTVFNDPRSLPIPSAALPSDFVSSVDVHFQAEEYGGQHFRATHQQSTTRHFLQAGAGGSVLEGRPDILRIHPEIVDLPVWVATYVGDPIGSSPGSTPADSLVIVADMVTGDIISRVGFAVDAEEEPGQPNRTALDGVRPNPFRGATTVSFSLVKAGQATLKVYNVLGQEVATLLDGIQPAGEQPARWNAAGLPSGVYFLRLTVDGATHTQKVVLQR